MRPKTFGVLAALVEARHRVVSKDELIERLWKDTAITDDTLVQCIVEIRRALEDDPRKPRFIKTLPKVGYRFIGPVEAIPPRASNRQPPESGRTVPAPRRLRWRLAAIGALVVTTTLISVTHPFLRKTSARSSEPLAVSIATRRPPIVASGIDLAPDLSKPVGNQ